MPFPVPLATWIKLQERIKETHDPTANLEAIGWAALGAAVSFLVMAFSLPFGVEWSKIQDQIEHVNWPAFITEIAAVALTLYLLAIGGLALHWARTKKKLQAKMGDWLIDDMQHFQSLHTPSRN
jgi:hypothetical protein